MKELNSRILSVQLMMGLIKSVHIAQLGASVYEIVNMKAVAVIDAQEREKRKKVKLKSNK